MATDLFDYLDWQQQRPCAGGRLVRRPRRLPEALEAHDVAAFMADLRTSRDRAITLLMLLGGLRAAEVRSACLREERPPRAGAECFVVLRGPTVGQPLTEAGLRRIFRTHRHSCGALRVRPHRLRHTYGTELAAAGIDLLVLREVMGHEMRFRLVRDPTTGTTPRVLRGRSACKRRAVKERNAQTYATIRLVS